MENYRGLLDVLPARYQALDFAKISELRLRLGKPPAVTLGGQERRLSGQVRAQELEEILQRATGRSAYACMQTLRQGFVTLPGGHRIGVCGSAVEKDGQMTGFSAISSLCIRVAHDVYIAPEGLLAHLRDSALIIGAPGCGKTTLLRACIRALSGAGNNVCVADARGELAGAWRGTAQFDLGVQTDVLTGTEKSEGMLLLLRVMSPAWIAVDEITAERDVCAMEQISYCGVKLLATAHAADLAELSRRPLYRRLCALAIFQKIFILDADRHFTVREAAQ